MQGGILKVDGFLNHQLDVAFLTELGKEIYDLFKDCGSIGHRYSLFCGAVF